MDQKKLKEQIWMTRICRINAEKRLLGKDQFVGAINIYYSLCTSILSIVLLKYSSEKMNYLAVIMSIVTLVSILYVKGRRYTERAGLFRKNYTDLQRLEIKLSVEGLSDEEVEEIGLQHCDLMEDGENHSPFDYIVAYYNSKIEYKLAHTCHHYKRKYWWGIIWRMIVKVTLLLLPVQLCFFAWKG